MHSDGMSTPSKNGAFLTQSRIAGLVSMALLQHE